MAGSVTITQDHRGTLTKLSIVTIEWVADENGVVPEVDFPQEIQNKIGSFYANLAITIPSQISPPSNNYNIEILDENNIDIYGSNLNNRSNTNNEQTIPQVLPYILGPRQVFYTPLKFKLTNNTEANSSGILKLYFIK